MIIFLITDVEIYNLKTCKLKCLKYVVWRFYSPIFTQIFAHSHFPDFLLYTLVNHLYKKNSGDLFPVTVYIFGKNEKCITFFRESGKSSGSSTLAAFNEEYSIRCFKEIYFLLGLMKYIICKNF